MTSHMSCACSGAVRVSGQMSVDAMVSRAALHVTGTLHSSSAVKGRVDLDRGRVLSVELDVPEEKMELFDIRSVEPSGAALTFNVECCVQDCDRTTLSGDHYFCVFMSIIK